jgi:hypothetical protein
MLPSYLVDAARRAAAEQPMSTKSVPDRTLLVDGDGLAYFCAGSESTSPGQARINMFDKLRAAKEASGASDILMLTTARGSDKGQRYNIATVKPYQGNRLNSRRPNNWEFMRTLVERDQLLYKVCLANNCEADDLFAKYADKFGALNVVHLTQDKDMRMVPGWHLDWSTHQMQYIPLNTFAQVHNDEVYGVKWFWLQMLQGDTADNIPGLPFIVDPKGKQSRVGPVKAEKLLRLCVDNYDCYYAVRDAYKTYYGDVADIHMLEQACLLWIRRGPEFILDVCELGNPMSLCPEAIKRQILERVFNAKA